MYVPWTDLSFNMHSCTRKHDLHISILLINRCAQVFSILLKMWTSSFSVTAWRNTEKTKKLHLNKWTVKIKFGNPKTSI